MNYDDTWDIFLELPDILEADGSCLLWAWL